MPIATVRAVKGAPDGARTDCLLVPVVEGAVAETVRPLGKALAAALVKRAKDADFRGRLDEALPHLTDRGPVVLIGLGDGAPGADVWRRAGARGRREAERLSAKRVGASLGRSAGDLAALAAFAEGFLLAGYRFDRYRSDQRAARTESLVLVGDAVPKPALVRPALDAAAAIATAVSAARDLVNEPPSVATPRFLAEHAQQIAKDHDDVKADVWGPERIVREGLNGLLAVAKGSAEEPRFITLTYRPAGATKRVALVGKGITFDSGGLSLKPPKSMETMKYDMAGGAAVLGAVAAAASLRLPVQVTGYVAATENLPGGRAQKPGDVIRYVNGRTVEVLNTDAEGRLVLADALVVAARAQPDALIDLATLTGAARVALGGLYACVLGTDQALVDALVAAGRTAGEPCWQLPLVREYRDDIKSGIADVKNVGGGDAGTIIGGLFLAEFVGATPWAHLDIAGPAWAEKETAFGPRGATGYGVRLLVQYLRDLAAGAS
jgi:leucyl aminopeptidase